MPSKPQQPPRPKEAAKDEGETRKDAAKDVVDVKAVLDSMQTKLEAGNVKGAQSDGARLRKDAAELVEVCERWNKDLTRLDADGQALLSEWEGVINTIADVQNRIREGERFGKAKNRFQQHLKEARSALAQTEEALSYFKDVEKVIRSVEYSANADHISEGMAILSTSARERTVSFRSATDAVLAAIQHVEDAVLS